MRLLALGLLALAGCDSAPKPFTTADGRAAYTVECSGTLDDWPKCYSQARTLCDGNYEELRRTDYARGQKPIRTLEFVCAA